MRIAREIILASAFLLLSTLAVDAAQPSFTDPDIQPQPAPPYQPNFQSNIPSQQAPPCQTDFQGKVRSQQAPPPQMDFSVILDQELDSLTAHCGDRVCARLDSPLVMGNQLFQPGSYVLGQVTDVEKARRHLAADLSTKRWLHANGVLSLEFDEIDNGSGSPAFIHAVPVSVTPCDPQQPKTKVGKVGKMEGTRPASLKPQLVRTGLGLASALAHSPIVPVVGGVIGVVAPSAVLDPADPSDPSANHLRHLKGMATGAIAGMPGGSLINGGIRKGHNVLLQPGTVLILKLDGTAI